MPRSAPKQGARALLPSPPHPPLLPLPLLPTLPFLSCAASASAVHTFFTLIQALDKGNVSLLSPSCHSPACVCSARNSGAVKNQRTFEFFHASTFFFIIKEFSFYSKLDGGCSESRFREYGGFLLSRTQNRLEKKYSLANL